MRISSICELKCFSYTRYDFLDKQQQEGFGRFFAAVWLCLRRVSINWDRRRLQTSYPITKNDLITLNNLDSV